VRVLRQGHRRDGDLAAMSVSEAEYQLSGNALLVRGTLSHQEQAPLGRALRELIDSGHEDPTLDLTGVDQLSSACAAQIMLAMLWMRQRNRSLLVRAGPQEFRTLQIAGAESLGTLELVRTPPALP